MTAASTVLVVIGVLAAAAVAWIIVRAVRQDSGRQDSGRQESGRQESGRQGAGRRAARGRWRRRGRRDEALLDPRDVADIDAALQAAEREVYRERSARLSAGLNHLVERRVPIRTVEPDWEAHAVRVRFADGTTVLVSGASPGAFGVLASRVREGSVCLLGCEPAPSGTNLVFDGPHGRETLHVTSAGLEQPG